MYVLSEEGRGLPLACLLLLSLKVQSLLLECTCMCHCTTFITIWHVAMAIPAWLYMHVAMIMGAWLHMYMPVPRLLRCTSAQVHMHIHMHMTNSFIAAYACASSRPEWLHMHNYANDHPCNWQQVCECTCVCRRLRRNALQAATSIQHNSPCTCIGPCLPCPCPPASMYTNPCMAYRMRCMVRVQASWHGAMDVQQCAVCSVQCSGMQYHLSMRACNSFDMSCSAVPCRAAQCIDSSGPRYAH